MDIKQLVELAEDLFTKKRPLDSLHQEIADNFFPEMSTFTVGKSIGDGFASDLMNSYPVLCRRDFGNQLATMLRPTARPWFHVARKFSQEKEDPDNEVQRYLQWFEDTMRRAMYDPPALFTRATKLADHCISAFGQAPISVELNSRADTLLYRCWHIRDMCWQEDENGRIGAVFRKWKPTAQVLSRTFPGRMHENVKRLLEKTPFENVEALHMVVQSEMYDEKSNGRPRWSIWYDCANEHIIEAKPIWGRHYIIPRWMTYESQYAYSPAVIAALPDARLIQAMTFTLLEAGEKAANPPMVATVDAVRSDISVYAGGVTWVDNEYDERLGEALRPITQDFRGFNYGLQMAQDVRLLINKAFFLDTLTMPQRTAEMTAYEVGQRVQEYIRNSLPIFEPLEHEYNSSVCYETFDLMLRNGAFGSPLSWPKKMQGMEFEFRFESPLHDAIEQQKGQKWMEAKGYLADAIALDQTNAFLMDSKTALRDVMNSVGIPATWLNSEIKVEQLSQAAMAQQQQARLLAAMEQSSKATANIAGAQLDMATAQAQSQPVI